MKGRNIFIGIAFFLILFNALPYFSGNISIPEGTSVDRMAYLVGYNILVVIALILLIIAFFVHRRVNRKRRKEMLDSFLK
ncbi:MAG: hypothetical protein ABI675_16510 [Chitinophagaceae bacterium]